MSDDPQDEVRRLLADARLAEPVPDDVVARLDRTLAELSAERAGTDRLADPPPDRWADQLAERRRRTRRNRIAGGLVAAAVVVAAGVGLSHLPTSGGGGGSDSSSAGSASRAPADGSAVEAPNQAQVLPAIRPGHVRADLLERAAVAPRRTDNHVCVAGTTDQVARPAVYAGRLAALLYDPVRDGQRRVTLYRCDGVHGGSPVASVLVPAR